MNSDLYKPQLTGILEKYNEVFNEEFGTIKIILVLPSTYFPIQNLVFIKDLPYHMHIGTRLRESLNDLLVRAY